MNRNMVMFLHIMCMLMLFFLYFLFSERERDVLFTLIVLSIVVIAVIIFFLKKDEYVELRGQYVRVLYVFLFGYVIVYYQLHVDYVFGNIDDSYVRFWVNTKIVSKALVLSSIGLVSFLLGYDVYRGKKKSGKQELYVYSLFIFKVISVFFLMVFFLTINPMYVFGGYGVYEMGDISRYASILFEISIIAIFIQNIYNLKLKGSDDISILFFLKSFGVSVAVLIMLYFVAVVMSGDRGPILYLVCGFISSYVVLTRKKYSKKTIIIFLVIFSYLVSLFGLIRNSDREQSFYYRIYDVVVNGAKPYKDLEGSKSIYSPTVELASSIRTFHNVINFVPETESYFLGRFQMMQLVTIIPLGQKIMGVILGIDEDDLTSERYVTKIIGGEKGSEGTSCLGDLYLDFGVFGIMVGLGVFGYYLRKIEVMMFVKKWPSLILMSAYIVFAQYAIYIPRSTLLTSVRNIVWLYVLIGIIRLFSKKHIAADYVNKKNKPDNYLKSKFF